jgi:hypothetical protein
MIREKIYLNTEQLDVDCKSHKLCTCGWDYVIYNALFVSNRNFHTPIKWTKYIEWKINHNMLTNKTITKVK